MRTLLLCTLAAAVLVGTVLAGRTNTASAGPEPDSTILRDVRALRDTTWRYQSLMGIRRTPYRLTAPFAALRTRWRQHEVVARNRYEAGPLHRQAWLCIHHYEGSWRDPNPPYYGGLQMDLAFQAHYGRRLLQAKGTANHWTPLEQMWVAEKAYRSGRGFYPWPNTARYCGLI